MARKWVADDEGTKKPEAFIEIKGEGGCVTVPGSPGACHPTCRPYELVRGDLTNIPEVSEEERNLLLDAARSFNEVIKPKRVVRGPSHSTGDRPGDDFNARASWAEILQPHEWEQIRRRQEVTYWRRPGKEVGGSATTNYAGTNLFYCFSSNGDPFDAETAYTLFAAYTFLNHNGDFSLAAADLARKGYGEPEGASFASFASFADPTPNKNRTSFASFAFFAQDTDKKWPDPLEEEAFHGLSGEFVHAIEPHTEADPAALLLQFLVAYGNCVGSEPHFKAEWVGGDSTRLGQAHRRRRRT